ncbi:MAG: undecaprenyl/decaprenyl-phosphate alpha-N-acetylglucosaminyl 1-phosphate transferase [Actinomycetota bacterium]|nr:undecaprenyl/decaprenyl-phosphate alpha-N-acetylglucosaminyl 1-phosphate transferase [Actinomycetota bacterium]
MSFADSLRALATDAAAVGGFFIAAALVLVLTPLVSRLAPRIGGVDDATDRPRVHTAPIPRIGGLAITAAIIVPAAILLRPDGRYLGILVGTVAVAALGLVDDIRGVRPRTKLLGVVAIALIPVAGYGVTFEHLTLPLIGNHDLGWAGYPLTVLWIATVANLVNLIDGMDALAAGIVSIAAFSFAVLAASFGRADAAALAAIVCGATLAFLRHNYHPAKTFMGDTGALALGFLLATVAVEGVLKTAATITLVAPLLVMAVPILDTSFVVLKRLKYRRPPWGADHNHFYHRFLRIGYSQRRTAAYLHVWAMLLAAWAILVRFVPPRPLGEWSLRNTLIVSGAGLVVAAASVWMVYTLEILKQRHLRLLRLARTPPPDDREEAVERAVIGARR